jgi:riboflavin kinase/FMN adenylyltransferase
MHVCLDIRKVDFRPFDKPVVTLGSFDGVHLGHQAIIRRLIEKSKEKERIGLVVTYEPHPQSVVSPLDAPGLLTTLEEKLKIFEELGVEETVVMNFDEQLREYSAEEFVEKILVDKLNVGDLVIGDDHAFGKNRTGKIDLLKETSAKYNFTLEVVPAIYVDGKRVSSSRIRKELEAGEFAKVIAMLGHSYPISGKVIRGKGRGKSLNYPTLNLNSPPRKLLPRDGVYSTRVQLDGKKYVGMMYIGPKPTFGEKSRSVEVHVFGLEILPVAGLEKDVIDSKVEVLVESWVREPMKFDDPENLKEQMKSDEKTIKQMFRID